MAYWQEYLTPRTVDEAVRLLAGYGVDAQIVAGGTDLILGFQQSGHRPVKVLVDVTAIDGLSQIGEDDTHVVIGAAVTHTQIERHPLVLRHGAALAESCSVVGGPQVRNVATIGGNVAHALPAADGTIGLLALQADVQVCTWTGSAAERSWQPLLSIFSGPGKNNLTTHQMLGAFRFPKRQANEGSAFDRIMRPQGVALPMLGLAAAVRWDADNGRVAEATIAIGPAGPIPFRATEAEKLLCSAPFSDDLVTATVAAAQAQAELRSSKHRATKAYRHEMVEVLLRRVLNRAVVCARIQD